MKASIAAISAVAALLSSQPATVHAAPGNAQIVMLGKEGRAAVSHTRDYVNHLFEEYTAGASSPSSGNVVEKGASWVRDHINDPRCGLDSHLGLASPVRAGVRRGGDRKADERVSPVMRYSPQSPTSRTLPSQSTASG